MKKIRKEVNTIGIYILLINVILIILFMSNDGEFLINFIPAVVSSTIALVFNIYFLTKSSKKLINIIFTILNGISLVALIIYGIIHII